MGHTIEYGYVVDENGKPIAVDVFIDGRAYRMDRVDLWKLLRIAETCFDELPDPIHDETNHQKVMETVKI